MNCRIPTFPETRSIYNHALRLKEIERHLDHRLVRAKIPLHMRYRSNGHTAATNKTY
jgi:hypothetical protein